MKKSMLIGVRRHVVGAPRCIWQKQVAGDAKHSAHSLAFMSPEHHAVRNFAVTELPHNGQPLAPEYIAQKLDLPLERVFFILADLEKHLTFLFRNDQGAVAWAYPVTVDPTPHRVTFSSGEKLYAAWGIDAIAVPFVQGQLRNEHLSFLIETQCAHCGQPISIEIDSDLHYRVLQPGADPTIFAPMVDFERLEDPSIIDAFWRKSIFFWSEEHAKEYCRQSGGAQGAYLTLPQAVHITRISHSALFGFAWNIN